MIKACELSGATILNVYKHKFEPSGVTILIGLSESYATIHTYVDLDNKDGLGDCFLDFFTCGSCNPEIGIKHLIDNLCSEMSAISMKGFKRGLDSGIEEIVWVVGLIGYRDRYFVFWVVSIPYIDRFKSKNNNRRNIIIGSKITKYRDI